MSSWRKPGPMAPAGHLAKIGRSVLPAIVTDGSRGMGPGFRQDDTERSTQNVRHRTFDTERVARAHDRGGRGSEYQMGAVGDHAFIQGFCPTPQAISGRTKFVELFQPHAYCAWG